MRLAIITETFLPKVDGIVRTLEQFLSYLHVRGHQALVIAPGRGPEQVCGFRVVRVPGVRFPLYPEITLAPVPFGVTAQLSAFRADLVHLAGPAILGVAVLASLGRVPRGPRLPVVAHYHTDLPRYFSSFGFAALAPLVSRYLTLVHNGCDATYAPAPSVAAALAARGMRRVRVCGRGVDARLFHPGRRGRERFDLLYVGRLSLEKHVQWLIDVADAFPERTLRVIGDGPARATLEHHLRRPGVTFSGILTGERLAEAYASASVFVFPSPSETFGQVVQEAMASGLPVVGVRSGGVADLIRPGETGWLCPPGDVRAFVGAIRALLSDPPSRARMGAAARRFAERQRWERVFDALLADYERLVAGRCHQAPGDGAAVSATRGAHRR